MGSEYADAGVDYEKIEPFKRAMVAVGRRTLAFPNARDVYIAEEAIGAHGALYSYDGPYNVMWSKTLEGVGNKNWISQWMYQHARTESTFHDGIGIDTAMMAANDVICQGAMPVVYVDEVAAGDSEWFQDELRAQILAESFFRACEMCGMALAAGESPALRYLIRSEEPVTSAPSLSGCATGIIAPRSRRITGEKLSVGDHIIGVTSSGLHANGISLVIKRALTVPEQFLHVLDNGRTLGEEALIPTRCYVSLVEALLDAGVDIHALLNGTGGGVAKIAYDKRPFTYRVTNWLQEDEIPPLFLFMQELGVTLLDCLTTFNWGIGFYIYVPEKEIARTLRVGGKAGYELLHLGQVEEGERQVIFEPEGITLPPV